MIPIRHFVILTLQFVTCLALTGALLVGFAFNYSYFAGNYEDRAEMNATFAQLLQPNDSIRSER